ncbi:hypothetical protein ACFSCV_15540 [Methylopila henanensis]|uniref:Uncharacterized protein n=1 Tax=Methylopila henanensis TaxID=873516 RepID=A0ABW4KBG8_9HYPH
MSDYLACLEASGGNKSEITSEFSTAVKEKLSGKVSGSGQGVIVRADGSIEVDSSSENIILGKMSSKFYEGAMKECRNVLDIKEDAPHKSSWVMENGILNLISNTDNVENIEIKLYIMIETFLKWNGNYQLHGRYASTTPGVVYAAHGGDKLIFSFPLEDQADSFREKIDEILRNLHAHNVEQKLTYLQNCMQIEYDFAGRHYRYFRQEIVPYDKMATGKINLDKMTFDRECTENFSTISKHPDAYKTGGQIGMFEFWSGNDRQELSNVIATDLGRQIASWTKRIAAENK